MIPKIHKRAFFHSKERMGYRLKAAVENHVKPSIAVVQIIIITLSALQQNTP